MRRSWPAIVLLTSFALGTACAPGTGSPPTDGARSVDASAGDADTSGLDAGQPVDGGTDAAMPILPFRYTLWAIGACDAGPLESCPVSFGMALQQDNATPIADATVTVNGVAATYAGSGGLYQGHLTGYAPEYRFDVTRAGTTSTVTFAAASDFDLTLSPAAPAVGTSATVYWTPSGAPDHEVNVTLSHGIDTTPLTSTDDGEEVLGAAGFTTPGSYQISVERRRFYYDEGGLPGGGSRPNLGLARTLTVEIP